MQSSFDNKIFTCQNAFQDCREIACECSKVECYEEYYSDEATSHESSIRIDWTDDDEPQKALSLWEQILQEYEYRNEEFEKWKAEQEEPMIKTSCQIVEYLNIKVFPVLLEGMIRMLREARKFNAIENFKCQFDGLDYLAEYLWNKNVSLHPERKFNWVGAFDIPAFRSWLQLNPRKIYPKSWLWSKQEAASIIQRNVRGWLVRRRKDVQELRQFWKAFAAEQVDYTSSLASINLDEVKDLFVGSSRTSIDLCKITLNK